MLIVFGTLWIRYIQIKNILKNEEYCKIIPIPLDKQRRINCLNYLCIFFMISITISMVTVASFRALEMLYIHAIGAFPLFVFGPILYCIQTWISFQLTPKVNTKFVAIVRLILTVFSILSVIFCCIFTVWSLKLYKKDRYKDRLSWKQEDGGYVQHVIAAASEWIYLLLICPFFATFVGESRRLKLVQNAKFHFTLLDK